MEKPVPSIGVGCRPVDPCGLFDRLCTALGFSSKRGMLPDRMVRQELPSRPVRGDTGGLSSFRSQYLLKEVLRKYPGFDLGIDTAKAAIASFREDERLNAITNERLSTQIPEWDVAQVILLAQRKISDCLGRFSMDRVLSGARFGPGSTTRLSRREAYTAGKLSGTPHVNASGYLLAEYALSRLPHWGWETAGLEGPPDYWFDYPIREIEPRLKIRNWEDVLCVPKNAQTDRTVAPPPDLSGYLQLGIGSAMRECLYYHGVDLSDQTINQLAALRASISGLDATVDLKSASNSITCGAVLTLMGPDNGSIDGRWLQAMECLRVPFYRLPDGSTGEYHLFSAMGNGYTFELESLIFWALAKGTCHHLGVRDTVVVYGDDIVVPTEALPLLLKVFDWFGFRLNSDKSFWDCHYTTTRSLFRESCGKHYLDGHDVTPFYVDGPLDKVADVVLLANNIVRWAALPGYGLDGRLVSVWLWVVSHLPKWARDTAIPFGESDDGLIKPLDLAAPKVALLPGKSREGTPAATVLPACYASRLYGLQARVYKEDFDVVESSDLAKYRAWLYITDVKRFRPPRSSDLPEFRGRFRIRWLKYSHGPMAWSPPVGLTGTRERGISVSRRVVPVWPHPGPWVTDDGNLEPSASTIDLAVCLNQPSPH